MITVSLPVLTDPGVDQTAEGAEPALAARGAPFHDEVIEFKAALLADGMVRFAAGRATEMLIIPPWPEWLATVAAVPADRRGASGF